MNPALVLGIIGHMSLLVQAGKDVEDIANNIFKLHKENFPSSEEFAKLAKDALQILAIGLLPIPAPVVASIEAALNSLISLASDSPSVSPKGVPANG